MCIQRVQCTVHSNHRETVHSHSPYCRLLNTRFQVAIGGSAQRFGMPGWAKHMMTKSLRVPGPEMRPLTVPAGKKLFQPAPLGSSENRDGCLARPTASQEEGNNRHAKAIVSRALPNSDALKRPGGGLEQSSQSAIPEHLLRIKASRARSSVAAMAHRAVVHKRAAKRCQIVCSTA